MQLSDWLAIGGLAVAAIGLGFTAYGIHRGNQNASASSLIVLNDLLRERWEWFLHADTEAKKQHSFAELMNALEIACAISMKGVFVGVSRELLTEYLDGVLTLLDDNDDARGRAKALVDTETTFKYVIAYLTAFRKRRKGHAVAAQL